MFLRYYVDLSQPFSVVEEALLRSPGSWVPGLAHDAETRGERLLAEVGIGEGGHRLGKRVEIRLGTPFRYPSRTVLPMTWRATGPSGLFPSLEADIEVAALGPARTQLSISARYAPPLGPIGRAMDRALLHRVAEATVKDFLDRAADAVRGLVPAAG